MHNIRYFTEYESEKLEYALPSLFFKRGYCEQDSDNNVKFKIVGFIEYERIFYVIFPKGMNKSLIETNNMKNAALLLKVLKKYWSSSYLEDEEVNWNSQHNNAKFFKTVEWLIQDYKTTGLLQRNQKVVEINGNGRVEWNNTIKKSMPVISFNKDIIYMELITSKNRNHDDAEIIQIHSYVLNDIKEKYGGIFNFKFHPNLNMKKVSRNYLIYTLKKSLASTNVDREIQLQKNLIAYLTEKSSSTQLHVFGTPFFANIWEDMCKYFLKDEEKIRERLPIPYWNFMGQERSSRQIPDILTTNGSRVFVFDAKYFQVLKGIDKLPGWKDLVKQFFYALSLKKENEIIYNVFLFPGTFNQAAYEYLGYAGVQKTEKETSVDPFGYIVGIGIDVARLFTAYVSFGDTILREQIHGLTETTVASIESNNKEKQTVIHNKF